MKIKKIIILGLILTSTYTFSQNKTATTEDGKKVVLNDDKTWYYSESKTNEKPCSITTVFVEPKGESKNQSFLKKVGATVTDLKKHISVDRSCKTTDITLTNISEQLGNGIYIVCIIGKEYKYRRSGSVFYRDGDDPLKLN